MLVAERGAELVELVPEGGAAGALPVSATLQHTPGVAVGVEVELRGELDGHKAQAVVVAELEALRVAVAPEARAISVPEAACVVVVPGIAACSGVFGVSCVGFAGPVSSTRSEARIASKWSRCAGVGRKAASSEHRRASSLAGSSVSYDATCEYRHSFPYQHEGK